MTNCSGYRCLKIGKRFDGSTWMFACDDHEKKWRDQMIDLGVSCIDSTVGTRHNCNVKECKFAGCYTMNGIHACGFHAENGAVCAYTDYCNDVLKNVLHICVNNHRFVLTNNIIIKCLKCP